MNELTELLEICTNVASLYYSAETGHWTITYKSNLTPDLVKPENLIEFLENA